MECSGRLNFMASNLQFRALVAVADTGSLKKAADQLHRTPSAVSMAISQLEDRLGVRLFENTRKNELTEIGSYIVAEARSLLDHEDRVSRGIRAFVEGRVGLLDVACIPSVANIFLPETLDLLWSESFSLNIRVRDSDSRTVVEMVHSDKSEIGVATAIDLDDNLRFTALFSDDMALVCSPDHPLATADSSQPLAWADLLTYRFIGNSSYLSVLTPELQRLTAAQAAYVPNITSLLSIVRSGTGITILPRINSLHAGPDIAFRSVGHEKIRRHVGVISHKGRTLSPGATRFLQALKSVIGKHANLNGFSLVDQTISPTYAEQDQ